MLVFRGYVVDIFSGVSRKSGKPFRRVTLSGSLYWADGELDPVKVVRVGDLEQFLPDFADDCTEGDLLEVPVRLEFQRGGKVGSDYVQPSLSLRLDWRSARAIDEVVYAGAQA